jgi:hypothetical protein
VVGVIAAFITSSHSSFPSKLFMTRSNKRSNELSGFSNKQSAQWQPKSKQLIPQRQILKGLKQSQEKEIRLSVSYLAK